MALRPPVWNRAEDQVLLRSEGTSLEDAAAKSEKVGESVMAIVNGLL